MQSRISNAKGIFSPKWLMRFHPTSQNHFLASSSSSSALLYNRAITSRLVLVHPAFTNVNGAFPERKWYATESAITSIKREMEIIEDTYRAGIEVHGARLHQLLRTSSNTQNIELIQASADLALRVRPNDRYVYHSAMSAYAKNNQPYKALQIAETMKAVGIKKIAPNRRTYNILLDAFANSENRGKCLTIMDDMQDAGFKPDLYTFNTLIKSHLKVGDLQDAVDTFELMKKMQIAPDVLTYTQLMDAHLKAGFRDQATELMKDMESRHIKPTLTTLTAFIHANCRENKLDAAQNMLNRLKDLLLHPNKITYTGMIEYLARNGLTNEAFQVFDQMKQQGVVPDHLTYTSLVKAVGHTENRDSQRCLQLYDEMQEKGIIGDSVFYFSLVKALVKSPDSERIPEIATKLVEAAIKSSSSFPSDSCKKLLLLLSRNDEHQGASAAWLAIKQHADKISIDHELCEIAAKSLMATENTQALEDIKKFVNTI